MKKLYRQVLFITGLLIVLWVVPPSLAQFPPDGWSYPTKFFEVEPNGNVQSPVILVDSGNNAHLFLGATMTGTEPRALYYSAWQEDRWTPPVDVLISPDGASIWPTFLRIDNEDYVHAFWSGSTMWHSKAHVTELDNPHKWSQPRIIPTDDAPFTSISLAQDQQGTSYLLYSNRQLNMIRLLVSTDNWDTFSQELVVYEEGDPDTWIGYPSIVIAPDGALWVSWREMEVDSGVSKGIAMTHSGDGGLTWSAPEQVISGYYFGGLQIVDDVMVKKVAGGVGTGGRYISFSYNNGATWTEFENISAGSSEGAQGISLVIDSANIWHFVVETGMTFARVAWDGNQWYSPDFIVPRDTMRACCVTPGRVTENVSVIITEGNRLHAFFEEDDRTIWYTTRQLDAPYNAPQALSPVETDESETVANEVEAVSQETTAPTITPGISPSEWNNEKQQPAQTGSPLILAAITVLFLVGFVLALNISRVLKE